MPLIKLLPNSTNCHMY